MLKRHLKIFNTLQDKSRLVHSRKQHLNTSHQTTRAIKQFYISNSIQVLWSSGRALALNTNGFGFKSHHFQKIFYFFLRYAKFLFAISSPKMHRFTSLKKHLKDTPVRKITYHHPCIDKANLDVYFLILSLGTMQNWDNWPRRCPTNNLLGHLCCKHSLTHSLTHSSSSFLNKSYFF